MSASVSNLLADYQGLVDSGADLLRLSPRAAGMEEVIGAFDAVRKGALPPGGGWLQWLLAWPAGHAACRGGRFMLNPRAHLVTLGGRLLPLAAKTPFLLQRPRWSAA